MNQFLKDLENNPHNRIIYPKGFKGVNSEDIDDTPYDEKYKDLWGDVLLPSIIAAIILVCVVLLTLGAIHI